MLRRRANGGANAATNGVTITVSTDGLATIADRHRSRPFDLVVANVLLPVHRELAPALAGVLRPGGSLVTTGYLVDDDAEVEALHGEVLEVLARRHAADWTAHRFRRPGTRSGPGREAQGATVPSAPSTGASGSSGSTGTLG